MMGQKCCLIVVCITIEIGAIFGFLPDTAIQN